MGDTCSPIKIAPTTSTSPVRSGSFCTSPVRFRSTTTPSPVSRLQTRLRTRLPTRLPTRIRTRTRTSVRTSLRIRLRTRPISPASALTAPLLSDIPSRHGTKFTAPTILLAAAVKAVAEKCQPPHRPRHQAQAAILSQIRSTEAYCPLLFRSMLIFVRGVLTTAESGRRSVMVGC